MNSRKVFPIYMLVLPLISTTTTPASGVFISCLSEYYTSLEHGHTTLEPSWLPSKIKYSCNKGYVLVGPQTIDCKRDASNPPPPRCIQRKSCPEPGRIPNGNRTPPFNGSDKRFKFDTNIWYSCIPGYTMEGSRSMYCTEAGEWRPSRLPRCTREVITDTYDSAIDCRVPYVTHGTVYNHKSAYSKGDRVGVSCNQFYTSGADDLSDVIVCGKFGRWVTRYGLPTSIDCYCHKPPPVVPRSARKYSTNSEGALKAVYSCSPGYTMVPFSHVPYDSITCHNGEWPGPSPSCESNGCPTPSEIRHGVWTYTSMDRATAHNGVGTRVRYECEAGYLLMGSKDMQCLPTKQWSRSAPICIADDAELLPCTDPGQIAHGKRQCIPHERCNMFYSGVTVYYTCDTGYTDKDRRESIVCGAEGTWIGRKPNCQKGLQTTAISKTAVTDGSGTLGTLLIIAGSVLGALLIIIMIVLFHRRKKEQRSSYRTIHPPPPAYSSSTPSPSSEPDRVALIAFADGVQVVLPSYDEVIKGPRGQPARDARTHVTRADYRPLPRLPENFRMSGSDDASSRASSPLSGSMRAESGSIRSDVTHRTDRQSYLSNTLNRDTDVFGSVQTIDTANVSDATSTTVTVDTCGSSNPSLAASHKATAGSLTSSSESLQTEEAPLLESSSHGRTVRMNSDESHQEDKE